MDYLATSSLSLFLRVLVSHQASAQSSQLIHPAILGLWEGVVLHRLSQDDPSSVLPLFKYLTTLWIGHRVAQDSKHVVLLTVVWSAVGALLSQAIGNMDEQDTSRRSKRRVSTHSTHPRTRTRSDASTSRRVAFSPLITTVDPPGSVELQPPPPAPSSPHSPLLAPIQPPVAGRVDPDPQGVLSPRVTFSQPIVTPPSEEPTRDPQIDTAVDTRGLLSPIEGLESANPIRSPTSPVPLPVIMPVPKSILRLRASSSATAPPMLVSGPETPAPTDTTPEFFPPSPADAPGRSNSTSTLTQGPTLSSAQPDSLHPRPPSVLPLYPTSDAPISINPQSSRAPTPQRKASKDEIGKARERPTRPTPRKISTDTPLLSNISNFPLANGITPSDSPPTYAPRSDSASPCIPVPAPYPKRLTTPVPVPVPPPKHVKMPVPAPAPVPSSTTKKRLTEPVPESKPAAPVPATPAPPSLPPASVIDRLSTISLESTMSAVGKEALLIRADLYRDKAREQEAERDAALSKQRAARSGSRVREAFLLAMSARKADALAKALHGKAERRYYLAHNGDAEKTPAIPGGVAAPTIDVHRLLLPEAIRKTEDALCDAIRDGETELRVIVGRGAHSKGGKAVLRPALKAEMEKQGLSVQLDAKNPGLLIVTWPT